MNLIKRIQGQEPFSKISVLVQFSNPDEVKALSPLLKAALDCVTDQLKNKNKKQWVNSVVSYFADIFRHPLSAQLCLEILSQVGKVGDELRLSEANELFDLSKYPDFFPSARQKKRHFIIITGPTNSGKTYEALEHLCSAGSGTYLAPLRLLALEGQESMLERKVPCNLITGEERIEVPYANHVSSTIEMADFGASYDVAVIDEFQLIEDSFRGRAWVAAVCGLNSNVIYLLGSADALASTLRLINYLGDTYELREKQRLSPLKCSPALGLKLAELTLRPGDALIAFNRADVLYWRDWCKRRGFTTAVVYGNLSPEVRKQEARRFASGRAQVLIATDAIGLGLNLPIRRVVFTTVHKFDGATRRLLTGPEIRQIAGRAGRFGLQGEGEVTCLHQSDFSRIYQAISEATPPKNQANQLSVWPSVFQLQTISQKQGTSSAFSCLYSFQATKVEESSLFASSKIQDALTLSSFLDTFQYLDLPTKLHLSFAPFSRKHRLHSLAVFSWAKLLNEGKSVPSPVAPEWLADKSGENYLAEAESLSLLCSAYLAIAYKVEAFYEKTKARLLKDRLSRFIENTLAEASALRHGDCDYSFLLFSLDAQTRNSILQFAGQSRECSPISDDPLTNVLCRVNSSKQRALEDEFKAAASGESWTDVLTKAFLRALPCLPFYKATPLEYPLKFLAWYVSNDTVILNKSSLISCLAAMFKPYPSWRSRFSENKLNWLEADLEKVFWQLGFTTLKASGSSSLFCCVSMPGFLPIDAVVLRLRTNSPLRALLPSNPLHQPYALSAQNSLNHSPSFSENKTGSRVLDLRALGLIK